MVISRSDECAKYVSSFDVVRHDISLRLSNLSQTAWKGKGLFLGLCQASFSLANVDRIYTCQVSRLRRDCHACGSKTAISRLLTPTFPFLTPGGKV